jgi:hypothetical protein
MIAKPKDRILLYSCEPVRLREGLFSPEKLPGNAT